MIPRYKTTRGLLGLLRLPSLGGDGSDEHGRPKVARAQSLQVAKRWGGGNLFDVAAKPGRRPPSLTLPVEGRRSENIGRRLATRLFPLLFPLLLAGCESSPSTPASAKTVDDGAAAARGADVTKRMLAAYRQAKSYADHGEYVEQSSVRGEGVERQTPFFQMTLAFERPNRLRLKFEEAVAASAGRKGYDVASNATTLRTAAMEIPNQIQEAPAPAELTADNFVTDPLVREALLSRPLGDVFPQLAMLLNQGDERVFPRDDHPRLLGQEKLRGHECYRVASTNPEGTRVLWIDRDSYALRRMELPVEAHRRAVDPEDNYLSLSVWIDFKDPLFDVEMDRQSFEMTVPEGAKVVEKFEEETAKDAKQEAPLN